MCPVKTSQSVNSNFAPHQVSKRILDLDYRISDSNCLIMELIRELIRALYHLDLFRRHVRNGQSLNLHSIKELFSTLSDAMRNPLVQPQTLTKILQNSLLLHQLEDKCPADAYNIVASTLLQDFTVLATNYSLTKVCLSCSTCSHEESVIKYTHHVDSSLLSTTDYPSFEFSLKTSLNSNEFCQKINCFGELKIFRVLKQEPSILALDFEPETPLTTLPATLRPYLVFNSTSSSELYLTSVLLSNPPATLFYHTRLFTWIYTNEETIIPLNTSEWSQVIQEPLLAENTIQLAFYTSCFPLGISKVITPPVLPVHTTTTVATVHPVPISVSQPQTTTQSPPHVHAHAHAHGVLSHQSSVSSLYNANNVVRTVTRCSSNVSSMTNASSSIAIPTSPTSATSSPSPGPQFLERIYENWPLDNDSGHGSIEPNNSLEDGSCSGSTSSGGSSRTSASTAISNRDRNNKCRSNLNINSNLNNGIYSSRKATPGTSCPTGVSPNGIMNYATIKRRRNNRVHGHGMGNRLLANGLTSVSVPDLTLDFKKAVSFNCKVTLVDDCNEEEYIPHPIFEKVLERMRKQS